MDSKRIKSLETTISVLTIEINEKDFGSRKKTKKDGDLLLYLIQKYTKEINFLKTII